MLAIWFKKAKSQADKKTIESVFKAAKSFRMECIDLLEDSLSSLQEQGSSENWYKEAGWPYYRANLDGQAKAYRAIINLLKDDNNDNSK